jgi:capsule polysaccharide export protein KpsE/RkpR
MSQFLNSTDIIRSISRFRKHLIIVGVAALVISAVFSGPTFLKPRFKSNAILYPSNLISYSNESPTEQMLQLMQSSEIRSRMIDAFHLKAHYDIDTVRNTHQVTDVIKTYEENVTIKQTEYESVEITVFDEDPRIASDMVDSIITYFNQKTRELQRQKSAEVVVIFQNLFDAKTRELDSLDALLRGYRMKYGLLDYEVQAKEYSRGLLRAAAEGKGRATADAKAVLDALADKGGEFEALSEKMSEGLQAYSKIQLDFENAKKDVTKVLTYSNTVTSPIPADKKSYPIRWLIVLVSVSSSLLVTFFVLLFMESSRRAGLAKDR